MKTPITAALAAVALLAAGAAVAADDTAPYGKRVRSLEQVAASKAGSYDVYVDLPTGFAYVNTVKGWVFTRKLDADALAAEQLALASR